MADFEELGGTVRLNAAVRTLQNNGPDGSMRLELAGGDTVDAQHVIACAGLHADQ